MHSLVAQDNGPLDVQGIPAVEYVMINYVEHVNKELVCLLPRSCTVAGLLD